MEHNRMGNFIQTPITHHLIKTWITINPMLVGLAMAPQIDKILVCILQAL
jgi:hypothetical protein